MDEAIVEKAWRIASGARPVGAGDGEIYTVEPATKERIRAALSAVIPLIEAQALERAAKVADQHAAKMQALYDKGEDKDGRCLMREEGIALDQEAETARFLAAAIRSLTQGDKE